MTPTWPECILAVTATYGLSDFAAAQIAYGFNANCDWYQNNVICTVAVLKSAV